MNFSWSYIVLGLVFSSCATSTATSVCWDGSEATHIALCPFPSMNVNLLMSSPYSGVAMVSWGRVSMLSEKNTINFMEISIRNDGREISSILYQPINKFYEVQSILDDTQKRYNVTDFGNGDFQTLNPNGYQDLDQECVLENIYAHVQITQEKESSLDFLCDIELGGG